MIGNTLTSDHARTRTASPGGLMNRDPQSAAGTQPAKSAISVASATAIGVGGMMGVGLYTLVGLASTTAGAWIPPRS